MLLTAVIIILREVLEVSLLISLMLLLSQQLKMSLSWLKWPAVIGLLGAFFYAYNIVSISNWFEGVGQEVLNASLQYLIYFLLAVMCIWLMNKPIKATSLNTIGWLMTVCISLSMTREFSEIIVYLQIFSPSQQGFYSVIIGTLLGAGIGLSISVIFYYIVDYISHKNTNNIIIVVVILSFLAAGMLLQATQLLIQADWLPSQQPLWDSSALIAEQSVVGQLLYAVFGYESKPSLIEVSIYMSGLFSILFFVIKQLWLDFLNKRHFSSH